MKSRLVALIGLTLVVMPSLAAAHDARVDARIAAMVAQVSAAHLRADDTTLVRFGTRNDFSETSSSATHGVFAARDWIATQFRQIAKHTDGRMTVRLDTYLQPKTAHTPRAVTESSVIATLVGSEPGRIYVVSSHYDDCNGDCTNGTRPAPGADDNGSGTSAVLEVARVMAHTSFRGTIIFACFDGEELGLWGSNHFAKEFRAARTPITADLNDDIIGNSVGGNGRSEPNVIRVFSQALPIGTRDALVNQIGSENDSPSRELARFAAQTIPTYVPSMQVRQIFRDDRFLRGGDQESFQSQGFPAIRFVEPHENFAHQHQNVRIENGVRYGDLLRFNNWQYLERATQVNVAVLAALALGPAQPKQVEMPLTHLGYTTTLRWKPAADAVSYEIVWRATDAPLWQHARDVGNATQATIDHSADNFIFAVRSVDRQGHRSVAVYPKPVRV